MAMVVRAHNDDAVVVVEGHDGSGVGPVGVVLVDGQCENWVVVVGRQSFLATECRH